MQNIGEVKSEDQQLENSSSSNQFGSGLFPKVEIKQEYDAGNGSEFADDERSNQNNEKSSSTNNDQDIHEGQEFSEKKHKLNSKNNSAKKDLRFPCSMCSKRFESKLRLDKHMVNIHTSKRCNICGQNFLGYWQLKNHVNSAHKDVEMKKMSRLSCNQCEKTFVTKVGLVHHVQIVHEGKRNFSCEICGKPFTGKNGLILHIQTQHEGRKDHICSHW